MYSVCLMRVAFPQAGVIGRTKSRGGWTLSVHVTLCCSVLILKVNALNMCQVEQLHISSTISNFTVIPFKFKQL